MQTARRHPLLRSPHRRRSPFRRHRSPAAMPPPNPPSSHAALRPRRGTRSARRRSRGCDGARDRCRGRASARGDRRPRASPRGGNAIPGRPSSRRPGGRARRSAHAQRVADRRGRSCWRARHARGCPRDWSSASTSAAVWVAVHARRGRPAPPRVRAAPPSSNRASASLGRSISSASARHSSSSRTAIATQAPATSEPSSMHG